MLKYLKKFAVDIVPSVAATVIGAYIVNHYINTKPSSQPAAAVSTAVSKSDANKPDAGKVHVKASPDAESTGIPTPGVKARGVSERAFLEKNAAAEKAIVVEKPSEKAIDKPVETTASLPPETKRPAPVRAAKAPPPVQSVATAAPADASTVDDRRDANDLARAAIERLRGNGGAPPRVQPSSARAPEAAGLPEEPRAAAAAPSALRPLPPPIMVSVPADAPDAAALRADPLRPTPPAEIPLSRPPLDLHAEASPKQKTNVAEEMLTAAKSMFNSVLPK